MAYTTIDKSSLHFNTKLYTGDESGQTITVGFQPDFTWIKTRDGAYNHQLVDAVRGNTKYLKSNATDAENTSTNAVTGFVSSGFTLGADTNAWVNQNSKNIVAWNWKAGGGQGSSNTDGSINTTYTSVNTTSGFSISTYTGTGSAGTIGHGLGVKPSMILCKRLTGSAESWVVYHQSLDASAPQDKYLHLNTTDAVGDSAGMWNDTAPTTSVFSVGSTGVSNGSGGTFVAYCFAEKTGFSKFGSYTGNGNANGPMIYTGFKPAFLIIKRTNAANDWVMLDSKRDPINQMGKGLFPMSNSAEATGYNLDFLSNGVKIRTSGAGENGAGAPFIFMAFAEAPLVGSNNVPCTAR